MRLFRIDRKRAVVGWVAFVIARRVIRRRLRQKLRAMRPAAFDRVRLLRA